MGQKVTLRMQVSVAALTSAVRRFVPYLHWFGRCISQDGYDHSYYFIASFVEDHINHHADVLLQ